MREVFFLLVLLTPGICSCVPASVLERALHDKHGVQSCDTGSESPAFKERA